MSLWDAVDSWPGAVVVAGLVHLCVAVLPYTPGESEPPEEFVDIELLELPPPPSPPPEPEPPPPEPEPPPGPESPDPLADPDKTSAVSNRDDDDTPDEEVKLRTGLELEETVEEAPAVRVGNTATPGFDADVAPGELKGFAGSGAGGGDADGVAALPPDVKAELLRAFQPRYPEHLVSRGIEGRVVLRIEVLANGRAGQVTLLRGIHPELDQTAVLALKRFRWRPARRDGRRVASHVVLTIHFEIRNAERKGSSRR